MVLLSLSVLHKVKNPERIGLEMAPSYFVSMEPRLAYLTVCSAPTCACMLGIPVVTGPRQNAMFFPNGSTFGLLHGASQLPRSRTLEASSAPSYHHHQQTLLDLPSNYIRLSLVAPTLVQIGVTLAWGCWGLLDSLLSLVPPICSSSVG